MVQRLSVFGLGKLGLPLAGLFARSGLRTVAIDVDFDLVEQLRAGKIPVVEPGLDELVAAAGSAITYTTDIQNAADTDASIIIVSTAQRPLHGALSSSCIEQACRDLGAVLRRRLRWRYHLVIISSTVMPGVMSGRIIPALEDGVERRAGIDFGVVYVPEFVALGEVVPGFQKPPFVLIGSDDTEAASLAAALYRRIIAKETAVHFLSTHDAELAKLAFNVFLCLKISFGNSLAQLSDRLGGADIDAIANILSLDPRIGAGLLRGGTPYGGPCLPRDIESFLHLTQSLGLDAPLVRGSSEVNNAQYDLIEEHVLAFRPRCVAVLGLSFKPGTSVTAESPAFEFVRRLQAHSIQIVVFDPIEKAREAAHVAFGSTISFGDTLAQSVSKADVILICSPDPSFTALASYVPPERYIVDPWGCVQDTHPGLTRPGRPPLHGRVARSSQWTDKSTVAS